jgi:hypothetical protein
MIGVHRSYPFVFENLATYLYAAIFRHMIQSTWQFSLGGSLSVSSNNWWFRGSLGFADYSFDVLRPKLKRVPALVQVGMPVIDASNSTQRSALMVQNEFDDMGRDVQRCHASCSRPS